MKPLWRTTIHIWTEDDPAGENGIAAAMHPDTWLSDLAHEAETGHAYCNYTQSEKIADPVAAGLQTDFFDDN